MDRLGPFESSEKKNFRESWGRERGAGGPAIQRKGAEARESGKGKREERAAVRNHCWRPQCAAKADSAAASADSCNGRQAHRPRLELPRAIRDGHAGQGCGLGRMVECPAGKLAGFFMRFTIRDLLWLTVVVAVALAVLFFRPHRVHWEYKVDHTVGHIKNFNADGDEGWELVDFESLPDRGGTVFYFKRPKSN